MLISRAELKQASETLEQFLRENENLKNRDKLLKQMFGQLENRKEIEETLEKNNLSNFIFLGKILIFFKKSPEVKSFKLADIFKNREFYANERNYYFIDEEAEYQRFRDENIEKKEILKTEKKDTDAEFKSMLASLPKAKIKSEAEISLYKQYFKNIEPHGEYSLEDIATEEFYRLYKLCYESEKLFINNREEIMNFVMVLFGVIKNNQKFLDEVGIKDQKKTAFKNLSKLINKFPAKKSQYLEDNWNTICKKYEEIFPKNKYSNKIGE